MASSINVQENTWKPYEKAAFRFFFVYFVLQAVPLDWKFYRYLFSINWFNLKFGDIFNISRYTPQFFHQETTVNFWGLNTISDWLVLVLIAAVFAIAWPWIGKRKPLKISYDDLYYSLRVILRYRLAIGVIAYGLIKFFPMQAPYPSLSNFNTNYGDLAAWKIFVLTLGVAPTFSMFLGGLELLGGLLLLYRKTTALGAFIILIFHGNVFFSNLAYEGGEAVYSLYLLQIAAFLLLHDLPRLVNLLSLNKPASPDSYKPFLAQTWQKRFRIGLKTTFIFFFVFIFGYKAYSTYHTAPYHYPQAPGLVDASGIYNVSQFRINGRELPYSRTDTVRWQNVVFEEWSTLSVKTAGQVKPWLEGIEILHDKDKDRRFELAGTASRHYYHYGIDSTENVLSLENKNPHYAQDLFRLRYERPDAETIILSGVTASGDSLSVTLNRVDKKYLYEEARKVDRRRGSLEL